jgi:hypothetical protein
MIPTPPKHLGRPQPLLTCCAIHFNAYICMWKFDPRVFWFMRASTPVAVLPAQSCTAMPLVRGDRIERLHRLIGPRLRHVAIGCITRGFYQPDALDPAERLIRVHLYWQNGLQGGSYIHSMHEMLRLVHRSIAARKGVAMCTSDNDDYLRSSLS